MCVCERASHVCLCELVRRGGNGCKVGSEVIVGCVGEYMSDQSLVQECVCVCVCVCQRGACVRLCAVWYVARACARYVGMCICMCEHECECECECECGCVSASASVSVCTSVSVSVSVDA